MSDNTENLVLEHLKHIRRVVDGIQNDVHDLKFRVGQVERSVASINDTLVHHTGRFDRIEDRLDTIEKRLDLVEA